MAFSVAVPVRSSPCPHIPLILLFTFLTCSAPDQRRGRRGQDRRGLRHGPGCFSERQVRLHGRGDQGLVQPPGCMHNKNLLLVVCRPCLRYCTWSQLRFLVIGNKHDCPTPIKDYFPSPGNNNSKLTLAHPWQKPNASSIGVGKDVMGGDGAGELSATCYYVSTHAIHGSACDV